MKESILLYLLVFFSLRINMKVKKEYKEMIFFYLNLSIVHISTNNVIAGLKFCIHVGNIHVEGTVSKIFSLYLSYYFMSKNG